MTILDLIQIPANAPTGHHGTVVFIDGRDPDLVGVVVGTQLKQGDNTWEVTAMEVERVVVSTVNPPVSGRVGLLLSPMTPLPTKGMIEKVTP